MAQARIHDLLQRDPFREITSVVRIADHDPTRTWREMDEYVPTERVKSSFREILDVLADTRRGATERVCIWISGFFGSGKSHFVKALGYLLENRTLQDPDGYAHPSSELLCRKLGIESFLPLLTRELHTRVIFINLLDYDPQSPQRPTISRLIHRAFLSGKGLSTEFWVAEWEKELQRLGQWDAFRQWVESSFGRSWEEERRLNAEGLLRRALPHMLSGRYRTEEEAVQALQESKRRFTTVNPSDVVGALRDESQSLHPHGGRVVILLDEVGLYIGDSVERLTDLNALAEQVVQQGEGKLLLIATAQEALTDLVPRLTADRHILEWLRDRFRLRLGLEPTEVRTVVASRLLAKTGKGVQRLQRLYRSHQGGLRASLTIDRAWTEADFIEQYPCYPYAVTLMQDILGTMRGDVEEARRLSGSERSMLKLTHVTLTGEGGITRGAEQEERWLISLDLFYDALAPDLTVIRSDQVRVIQDLAQLGNVNGFPVVRVAKVLFLLQQAGRRYPPTLENIAAALVDRVDSDPNRLRECTDQALRRLQEAGWIAEEEGKYRLLTPAEHDLERDVRANYPRPAELKEGAGAVVREMLRQFQYVHGQIRRALKVAVQADEQSIHEGQDLKVVLFTPFTEESREDTLEGSIAEPDMLFWYASEVPELKPVLERVLAVEATLEQWRTRTLNPQQEEHRSRLEREAQTGRQVGVHELMRKAFLNGTILLAGQELTPGGNDLETALRQHLRDIAGRLYTEFVDDRPDRDQDCSAILPWRPGSALPAIYDRLGIVTGHQQIRHDAALLASIKAELARRHQMGHSRTGKDLLEHFERVPYGYDPRLVRLLMATLLKAGVVGAQYHNQELTAPTHPQARSIFDGAQEFRRASFQLLPEVDWRRASELCSSLFGVQGGDTFERTAAIVHEQAVQWERKAGQLGVRCRDNSLPDEFAATCQRAVQALGDIIRLADPNVRLRRFMESVNLLQQQIPLVRRLEGFNFDQYRTARAFVQEVSDWATRLPDEAARRWEQLRGGIGATALLERWHQTYQDYVFLLARYRSDYSRAHREFQESFRQALKSVQQHEAFQRELSKAEQVSEPLRALLCEADDPTPTEETSRCPACLRPFVGLSASVLADVGRQVEEALDALLPRPTPERIAPLSISRAIVSEEELQGLASELRRYWRRAQGPLQVRVYAEPAEPRP